MEMAISNTKKQQRFYKSKIEARESKISCWLPENDRDRLVNLMDTLGYSEKGKKQQGYSSVFSQALRNENSIIPESDLSFDSTIALEKQLCSLLYACFPSSTVKPTTAPYFRVLLNPRS